MANEKFNASLQQTIVACIALCDDDNAKAVVARIEPDMFDKPLDDIVSRCLEFRKEYGHAPGRSHIDDVLAHVIDNKEHNLYDTYIIILNGILTIPEIDTVFVRSKVNEYARLRKYKEVLESAAVLFNEEGVAGLDGIDDLLRDLLRGQEIEDDLGFTLSDKKALEFLEQDELNCCRLNIKELDNVKCIPTKKELLVFLAPRNKGKSMFLIHCGKMGILANWNVLHYTLENSKKMTAMRYFQSLFAGAKKPGEYETYKFLVDENERPSITVDKVKPDFIVYEPDDARKFLKEKIERHGKRLDRLWIREYPTGQLSFSKLEKDMDQIEAIYKFVPDMLIIDYPQLMKFKRGSNEYAYLDEVFVKLRGLAVERNIAVVVVAQGNRASEKARTTKSSDIAGDIGILGIADNLISYSQTEEEEKLGLARLSTEKVRNDQARQMTFITQMYSMSQFCLSSTPFSKEKSDLLAKYQSEEVQKPQQISSNVKAEEPLSKRTRSKL